MIESKITVLEAITVILTCKRQSKPDKNSCVRSFKLIFRSNKILVPIFEVGGVVRGRAMGHLNFRAGTTV